MGRERRVVISIFGIGVLISILFISIPEAQAELFTLEDENSVVTIEVDSQDGVNSWNVDSGDNLFQQQFWFRICEDSREFSIDTLTRDSTEHTDEDADGDKDTLTIFLSGEGILIDISWTLKGGPIGSGASTILETINITNEDAACEDIDFFQYTDLELAGVDQPEVLDDTVEILGVDSNLAFQSDAGSSALSETVVSPIPDRHEVSFFGVEAPFNLLIKLNDGDATDLNNENGPISGDDIIWAFQWDFELAGPFFDEQTKELVEGETVQILKCKRIGPLVTGITGSILPCEPLFTGTNPASGHEPPTIGMNLRGNYQIVENGICIDAKCWTVTENFHVDFELVELFTSEHTISNTIYCSRGVDTCNHITLSAGPYHENTRNFDEALWNVSVDKNLLGELTVTKDDPDGYLGVTTCTAQITLEERWFTSCTIDFKLPTPGGFMLGVQVQDNYKGVRNWFFNDGIEIIDTYGYPSVDTEFESSLDVPRLCLSDDPNKRTSCAFAKKVQLEIERAEKLLT